PLPQKGMIVDAKNPDARFVGHRCPSIGHSDPFRHLPEHKKHKRHKGVHLPLCLLCFLCSLPFPCGYEAAANAACDSPVGAINRAISLTASPSSCRLKVSAGDCDR